MLLPAHPFPLALNQPWDPVRLHTVHHFLLDMPAVYTCAQRPACLCTRMPPVPKCACVYMGGEDTCMIPLSIFCHSGPVPTASCWFFLYRVGLSVCSAPSREGVSSLLPGTLSFFIAPGTVDLGVPISVSSLRAVQRPQDRKGSHLWCSPWLQARTTLLENIKNQWVFADLKPSYQLQLTHRVHIRIWLETLVGTMDHPAPLGAFCSD